MGVVVEYPVTVHVDNVGVILILEKIFVSQQTKHIDMHHQFICDYVEYIIVKNQFFCSEENLGGPLTKNRSDGTFESITSRYVYRE